MVTSTGTNGLNMLTRHSCCVASLKERPIRSFSERMGSPPSGHGSEFFSQAMDLWAYQHGVRMAFSRPGKPTDNAFVESFNGSWRLGVGEYNESPPHSALGEKTPNEFAKEIPASRDFLDPQTAENSL